jgi:hypothetical protein
MRLGAAPVEAFGADEIALRTLPGLCLSSGFPALRSVKTLGSIEISSGSTLRGLPAELRNCSGQTS